MEVWAPKPFQSLHPLSPPPVFQMPSKAGSFEFSRFRSSFLRRFSAVPTLSPSSSRFCPWARLPPRSRATARHLSGAPCLLRPRQPRILPRYRSCPGTSPGPRPPASPSAALETETPRDWGLARPRAGPHRAGGAVAVAATTSGDTCSGGEVGSGSDDGVRGQTPAGPRELSVRLLLSGHSDFLKLESEGRHAAENT